MASSLGPWRVGGGGVFDPLSWDVWDPLDFGFGGDRWWGRGGQRDRDDDTLSLAHAKVDWRESEDAHILQADIPGVRKEEVQVQVVDGNILQISGQRTKEEKVEGDKWHRLETQRGSFMRRFRLPENANVDNISCNLDHGVLTVRVPKKDPSAMPRANVKTIDIR